MARPQVVTDMQIWMLHTGLTDITVAEKVNAWLVGKLIAGQQRSVNERHIGRWRKGLAMPRYPQFFEALEAISGGRVTANSFVHGRMEPPDGSGSG